MSMHEIEAYVEAAVRAAAVSDMTVSEKRNMIYSLFQMEEYGDCGFTNRRTLAEMIASQYTFVFDKTQMYDYAEKRAFYDGLSRKDSYSQGDVYSFVIYNPASDQWEEQDGKVCVDSGSEAWRGMVNKGAVTGEGAQPVERLADLDVLRKVNRLLGPLDDSLMQAHALLFIFSGALDALPEEEYPEHFGMTKEALENMVENGE